jgi:hypothetical protein
LSSSLPVCLHLAVPSFSKCNPRLYLHLISIPCVNQWAVNGTRVGVPHKQQQTVTTQGLDPRRGTQPGPLTPGSACFVGRTWGYWGKPWLTCLGATPWPLGCWNKLRKSPAQHTPIQQQESRARLPTPELPAPGTQWRAKAQGVDVLAPLKPFTRQPGHHPPCVHISNAWPLGFFSN